MENPLLQIKTAIIEKLNQLDPDVEVFAEEILMIREEGGDVAKSYYFVESIPTGNQTVDSYFTDMSVLVDIAFHDRSERNDMYLQRQMDIDELMRPVLSFGDRHITINSASSRIVDRVLHYTFTLQFRVSREKANEFEFMGELEVIVKEGE